MATSPCHCTSTTVMRASGRMPFTTAPRVSCSSCAIVYMLLPGRSHLHGIIYHYCNTWEKCGGTKVYLLIICFEVLNFNSYVAVILFRHNFTERFTGLCCVHIYD